MSQSIIVTGVLVNAFFAICFLQSGVDKVVDHKGNLEWLEGHFSTSPFKNMVPALLRLLTLMEIGTGLACCVGIVELLMLNNHHIAYYSLVACASTLLCLFSGQRLAKDYPGASTIAVYFGIALLGLLTIGS